jgi:hypothetical protein
MPSRSWKVAGFGRNVARSAICAPCFDGPFYHVSLCAGVVEKRQACRKVIDDIAPCVKQSCTYPLDSMNSDEFSLHHHEIKLELELFRRNGKAFQDFFEQIMQKADRSFQMIKPMGREGDWKADGYSTLTGTIYQCYAPEGLTGPKAAKKIKEDFDGARERWKDKMRRWVFVWSSERALPPQVVALLADLKREHPELIIEDIGRAGLWNVVRNLSLADRESILGVVPDVSTAPITTAAEIQVLMRHLGSRGFVLSEATDFDLTAIAEKLQRNRLSAAVIGTVKPAMPVAKLVGEFVTNMPDPNFSQIIAVDLAEKYSQLAASTDEPDVIFGNLVEYALGAHQLEPKFFWAAAGIISYYFELCDIFER